MRRLATFSLGLSIVLAIPTIAQAAVQKPADQVFATQQNTGKNSLSNCAPASAKMILNSYGLGLGYTVQQLSDDYSGIGDGSDILKKFGLVEKVLETKQNVNELAMQYLDKGYIVSVGIYNGFGPHEGVALDYRNSNGYLEYYVLDPSTEDCEPYWATLQDGSKTVGSVNVSSAWVYNTLEKITVEQTSKTGEKFSMNLYYDASRGVYYYSCDDDIKYMGEANSIDTKAKAYYENNKNKNWFNLVDTVYDVDSSAGTVLMNNDAYFVLQKDYVQKTWGITR